MFVKRNYRRGNLRLPTYNPLDLKIADQSPAYKSHIKVAL